LRDTLFAHAFTWHYINNKYGTFKDKDFARLFGYVLGDGYITHNRVEFVNKDEELIKDFKTGAADHLNSMKSAILLYDENLKGLIKINGQKVLTDPKLEEYLKNAPENYKARKL